MSRQSPTGFAFSMLIEIAAVVIIVSLLPRFDLRPKANAAAPAGASEWSPPPHLTSFQRPHVNERTTLAPPLIEPAPIDRRYVEQHLDQASQQLVNTLGSAVSSVASQMAQSVQPTTQPPEALVPSMQPERQVTLLPASAGPLQPVRSGSFPTEPRPWLKY